MGFILHHLAVAGPTEASTLSFLVITISIQLACSLAVRMLVSISVVLGLPTNQVSVADVDAQVCKNLWIADGLNPISWSRVFENFENGYPLDYSFVLEKAEAEQESDKELEMVGATLEGAGYGTPAPRKKVGVHIAETQANPLSPHPKANATRRLS